MDSEKEIDRYLIKSLDSGLIEESISEDGCLINLDKLILINPTHEEKQFGVCLEAKIAKKINGVTRVDVFKGETTWVESIDDLDCGNNMSECFLAMIHKLLGLNINVHDTMALV